MQVGGSWEELPPVGCQVVVTAGVGIGTHADSISGYFQCISSAQPQGPSHVICCCLLLGQFNLQQRVSYGRHSNQGAVKTTCKALLTEKSGLLV